MFILADEEGLPYLEQCAQVALSSPCFRSRCGSVIVNHGRIIGSGYNSPPKDIHIDHCIKDALPDNFKSDKTCCIHAEQRAIMDALIHNSDDITGSRLYFIRLDEAGNKQHAGDPYCTICSKMALDAGIAEFVLWRPEGICVYDTHEYNLLSFQYRRTV